MPSQSPDTAQPLPCFLAKLCSMEQQTAEKTVDEVALGAAIRGAGRKPVYLRIAGWGLVTGCALTIGTILISDPKVTQKLSTLTREGPTAAPVEAAQLPDTPVKNPDFDAGGAGFETPLRALLALGSVSQSARSALGFETPADQVSPPPLPEADRAEASEGSLDSPGSSFFASDQSARPSVSIMPQSRIPVRRAGVSVGN